MPQANFDFSAYITERTRDFVGRKWVFAEIDCWLADPDGPHYFIITGEPGIGKTAIAARLTQFSNGHVIPPADYARVGEGSLSAVHFCSVRNGGWISPDGFARSLSAQLATRYPAFADALASDPRIHVEQKAGTVSGTMIGAQFNNYYAETSEALFNDLVRTPLQALCNKNCLPAPLTVLVDGLDEGLNYTGRTNIVRLLAACWDLPSQVRLLLTSRPVDGVLETFRPLQPFILYARSEENLGDVGAYVEHRFATSASLHDYVGDEAQVERVRDSLVARSGGNFLVVSKVLDGAERGELSLDDPEALPADLQDLYAWFLNRLIQGDMRVWRSLLRPVLGVLAVAQEPADAPTLCRWTRLTYRQVADVLHDLREFLEPALEAHYRLYHESVVDFLTGDNTSPYYLDAAEYHQQIAASYTQPFVENGAEWIDCDLYGLRHLPAHLLEVGQTETLRGLLFNFDWLQAKLEATDPAALIADYEFLPGDTELRLVREALQLSAHVLTQDRTQLAGQLAGRLMFHEAPKVQALLEQIRQWRAVPWLRLLTPSLTLPGGPLLRTLTGHSGWVNAVAVTPDSKRVVSASSDHTLKVWDLESGAELLTLQGHTFDITAVAVTPDGRRVVSASSDQTLKVWDLESGAELLTLRGHMGWVNAVVVIPDASCAVSASEDHTLKVWNLRNGSELFTLRGHTGPVHLLGVALDGQRIISASVDHTLMVWDLESGTKLRTLQDHAKCVRTVAVMPNSQRAISAAHDHALKVWDLANGAELLSLRGHTGYVNGVAITPDGRRAISASEDNTLKVWDLGSGAELLCLRGHVHYVNAVAVTPDGQRVISTSRDHTLKVWNLLSEMQPLAPRGHTDRVNAVAVTPDGQLAISASSDTTLKVWDPEGRKEVLTLEGHTGPVTGVATTPDSRRAVSASSDRTLKVWDLEDGTELLSLCNHTRWITAVAVTPDGQRVISASRDYTLKVWDLENGTELRTLRGHTGSVRAVAVTLDGGRAVSASSDGTLRMWDLESGKELSILQGHSHYVNAVAITPDGQQVLSASSDRTLKMWNLEDGRDLYTLTGHTGKVTAVATMSNGRYALSASDDTSLKVWDLESLKVIASFTSESPLRACAAVPDSMIIVAGGESGRIHILHLEGV